jgi:AIPR protein
LPLLDQIRQEIAGGPYYQQNFSNDGQRFVAWYLRRVLLRDPVAAKDDITDGQDDKQIDALVIDDDDRRVRVIQGKFIAEGTVDAAPLREVLGAWIRLQDLETLQRDANDRLKRKLEAVRKALEDDYEVTFELLTTGSLTDTAKSDLKAFADQLEDSEDFSAALQLVDEDVLQTRLAEAEAMELPSLDHLIGIDPERTLVTRIAGAQTVLTVLTLKECLKLPGILDGRLFRKNVRQSLGTNNRVNRALRSTITGDKVKDFFFYRNGITALCDELRLGADRKTLSVKGLSVVNGCQSLSTIYSVSERVRSEAAFEASVLFRFYEIPDRTLADRISINTNSQSAVKPRDLRSNDKVMVGLKRAFEARYPEGYFICKRGEERPADRDAKKTVDAAILARMLMAWHCQRPNISYNEKKLFDEYYKTLFHTGYDPSSVLALQTWLNAIDASWQNLTMNDALKAGRAYVKYHLLFSISAIIAAVSGQPNSVPDPAATAEAASRPGDVLPLAATCLENAMQSALNNAQVNGKVFSPQNWLKTNASVTGQMLVAGTIAGMLPNFPNGTALVGLLRVGSNVLKPRWAAD